MMRIWVYVLWSLLAFFPARAWAYLETMQVLPPNPTSLSSIAVYLAGSLPDGCWKFTGYEVRRVEMEILVEILYEIEGGPCPDVMVPYECTARLPRLLPGMYLVTIIDPQDTKSFDLDVAPGRQFVLGDANSDGARDVADAVFILLYLYASGDPPPCEKGANVNRDGTIDLSDAILLLDHLFRAGPRLASPVVDCALPEQCILNQWPIFGAGHWECDCGECKAVTDSLGCGDGFCDLAAGETPESCPSDCTAKHCRPVCTNMGTRSEGWYDVCTQEFIDWAQCAECQAECRACGSKSEGWYDTCTGEVIVWTQCCQ